MARLQPEMMVISKKSTKFIGVKGNIIGKSFLVVLAYDLDIQYEIKHIFISKPTFAKYTEVDEVYKKLLKMSIPSEQRWDKLCELLE